MMSRSIAQAKAIVKDIYIIRHGQALHNPRAEAAKEAGCTTEEFLELMRQDDAMDAELTTLGQHQASQVKLPSSSMMINPPQLIVSSPLSRALQTADLVLNANQEKLPSCLFFDKKSVNNNNINNKNNKKICCEYFREVNGWLLNAKRRNKQELQQLFPHWDFSLLETNHDSWWTSELESYNDCAERGYLGFCWLLKNRPETNIILVSHGGILRFTMQLHSNVIVRDGRLRSSFAADARFGNCEIRHYQLSWLQKNDKEEEEEENNDNDKEQAESNNDEKNPNANNDRPSIVLTLVD